MISGARPAFWQRLMKDLKKNYVLYLFILPGIIVIFVFNYVPMYGVQIAFRNFKPARGIVGSDWVGLKNFLKFFSSYKFELVLKNTIILSLYRLIAGFPMPIIFAITLNQIRNQRAKKLVQTVSYMPHFISTIVICGLIRMFLNPNFGIYGNLMRALGFGTPSNLMNNAQAFRHIYVFSGVWQNLGWDSIIYIAALTGVDPTLYEAATVDGASDFQKIRFIDIPSLIPTATLLLIMSCGSIMSSNFEKAYLLQSSINLETSELISTYTYKMGMLEYQYSFSAAVDLFNTVINFILLSTVNGISRRLGGTSMW